MKQIVLSAAFLLASFVHALPAHTPGNNTVSYCAGDFGEDYTYYNLFAQENIEEPQYQAFLLTYDSSFYTPDKTDGAKYNENIEDWQKYLGITYEQALYLVFQSKREDLRALAQENTTADKKLGFIDKNFIKKHKQALLYLAYAKYLEPYMAVKGDRRYYWGNAPEHTVEELDYDKVINVLEKSWQAETDKDLKLRYGYQLVRFAHYYQKYREAIDYFHTHVESLDYKPIMYYYALDQKGGAERGLGNYMQAHYDFFRFFTHTKNRKEQAYTSMRVTNELDFEVLLSEAKNTTEKNDLYMLLGYRDFNNPLSSFNKIIQNDPNAPQAKVLMARTVNQLERNFFPTHYYCAYNNPDCMEGLKDHRLPLSIDSSAEPFLKEALESALQQSQNNKVREQEFWQLTTAWLYFIRGDYQAAGSHLEKVRTKNVKLLGQKDKLAMLIAITQEPEITESFEETLMKKYGDILDTKTPVNAYYSPDSYGTRGFITDVLANRYFLQKDYAKAFLLQNPITALEYNPDTEILSSIEKLYHKQNKNAFEQMLVNNIPPVEYDYQAKKYIQKVGFDLDSYAANMKGNVYLWQGEPEKALSEFKKTANGDNTSYKNFSNIPRSIFGYNRIECFECPEDQVMQTDYADDFTFIPPSMNKKQLAEILIRLKKEGEKNDEKAAKANYLLGNFFFNTSLLGYYRNMLTFSDSNANNSRFHNYPDWNGHFKEKTPKYILYFKSYEWNPWFKDNFDRPLTYLKLALDKAVDDELKARILFAASKCEQGIFYSTQNDPELNNLKNLDYKARQTRRMEIKTSGYRSYFQLLKGYSHTSFYDEVKTNCKYFDYYSTNY
ncbi:hypothetical protein [Sinomicrobium sp. M5D2P9]